MWLGKEEEGQRRESGLRIWMWTGDSFTSLELDREFRAGSLRGFADGKGSFSYFGPAALVSGLYTF
jgi:hypothetical protein